jgi:glutathione S-transferase
MRVLILLSAAVGCSCFVGNVNKHYASTSMLKNDVNNLKQQSASSALNMGFFDGFKTPTLPTISTSTPKVQKPANFQAPEPKPLTVTDWSSLPSLLSGSAALAARLGTGVFVLGWKIESFFAEDVEGKYALQLGPLRIRDTSSVLLDGGAPRPRKPLVLYEYEASPYCKRVREMVNLLDLTVEYRPCPGARAGFSDELFKKTGKRTVPFLVDPNTGTEMFESADQIEYLLDTYGPTDKSSYDKKALWPITSEKFAMTTSVYATQFRGFAGSARQANARPDNEKMQPLELWGYECSPFVKPVREKLGELCLKHTMVSCSRGSANRDKMTAKNGRFQVPLLIDPNTGIEMYESLEIVKYLDEVYTV